MALFATIVGIDLLLVALYETELLPSGWAVGSMQPTADAAVIGMAELLTIALIPLSLRLFKFQKIDTALKQQHEAALWRWGLLRLLMLALPLLGNTLLYYAFMNTSYGYLAIITLLCMPFVYPTRRKCADEAYMDKEDEA